MDDSSDLSSPPTSVPSSPLSMLSNSPSPPPEDSSDIMDTSRASPMAYPSPPASQQTSQSGSPTPDGMDSSSPTINVACGPPPAKRRRISKESSKERTTEHLSLNGDKLEPEQRVQLDRILHVLHKSQKIVIIAGAGISVSAGIPDFRSSRGLFRSLKDEFKLKGSGKDLFDASVYKDDSSTSSFHEMIREMSRQTRDAKPTLFHHLIATIASEGRLLRLYTQNVDGIDTRLEPLRTTIPLRKLESGSWPKTVQVHGGLDKMVCSKCHELSAFDATLFVGPVPPACPQCLEVDNIRTNLEGKRSHGIGRLRPRMVLYNEHNPDDEAIGTVTKEDLRKRPDAVIVVGTTLKVPGVRRIVREMCGVVRDRRGGVTIWINNDPPPVSKDLEDCWDIIVQGKCDEVAKQAAMRKWDDEVVPDNFSDISEEDARKAVVKSLRPQLYPNPLVYLKKEPLPSPQHRNNSFLPPPEGFSTPRKNLDRAPTPSPASNRRFSVVPSVESSFVDTDTSILTAEGETSLISDYPTPSKSRRGSPVGLAAPGAKPKAIKLGGKVTKAATKPTKAPKRSNIKFVKKPASQSKSKAKTTAAGPQRASSLTNTFKQSKGGVPAGKDIIAKTLPTINPPPSKLRQVANAVVAAATAVGPEPMHVVSPLDHRHNSSPPLPTAEDVLPYSCKLVENPMRISSVINP